MPIVSSQILNKINKDKDPSGRKVLLVLATDQTGFIWDGQIPAPPNADHNQLLADWVADLTLILPDNEAEQEEQRARNDESNSAQHQTQAELDRKVLSRLMQIIESLEFSTTLQWFRDFEVRAGSNANARATYLGVPKPEYDLVATRYNQITGVKSGLEADRLKVWNGSEGW